MWLCCGDVALEVEGDGGALIPLPSPGSAHPEPNTGNVFSSATPSSEKHMANLHKSKATPLLPGRLCSESLATARAWSRAGNPRTGREQMGGPRQHQPLSACPARLQRAACRTHWEVPAAPRPPQAGPRTGPGQRGGSGQAERRLSSTKDG